MNPRDQILSTPQLVNLINHQAQTVSSYEAEARRINAAADQLEAQNQSDPDEAARVAALRDRADELTRSAASTARALHSNQVDLAARHGVAVPDRQPEPAKPIEKAPEQRAPDEQRLERFEAAKRARDYSILQKEHEKQRGRDND